MKTKLKFKDQLRTERKRIGLNQHQLAELLGVSFDCVSVWERGITVPAKITQEGALARLNAITGEKD